MLRAVSAGNARWLRVALGVIAGALLLTGGTVWTRSVRGELALPRTLKTAPFVGSSACQRCHPQHYESFRRTFHRSMTQEASPASVLGRWDGASLDYLGVRARMQRTAAGEFEIAFSADAGAARWRAKVERTVGSHRYQQYLARTDDVYFRLPIAWDVAQQQFIHMNGAFLTPDPELRAGASSVAREDYDRHVTRWNDNCVFCHNVHPNPRLDLERGRFATEVAELGVACEACHGPAGEHARQNLDPLRRYALHATGRADPTIRNPARMPAARSAEVCGRCHGQRMSSNIAHVLHAGDAFVPGEELAHYSRPLARDTRQNGREGLFAPRFWTDGTPRLTAYEFQGYLQSPCARDANFSCESCHAMHAGDPNGQIRPDRSADGLCTGCHEQLESEPAKAAHSRHDARGPGARCRSCHMPDVVYGLVSVRLSHRIEVPRPAQHERAQRPDACTLCHVDRSRAWASDAQRSSESGVVPAADGGDPNLLPELAGRLLGGDPIERSVAASALGKPTAHYAATYRPIMLGLLVETLRADPYPAVRAIALRSLRALLERHHPEQLGALGGVTQNASVRSAALQQLAAALGPDRITAPDAALVAALRARAQQAAIEIGE